MPRVLAGYRVWWLPDGERLVCSRRAPQQYRDFGTKEEAQHFADAMQDRFPHRLVYVQTERVVRMGPHGGAARECMAARFTVKPHQGHLPNIPKITENMVL